MTTNVENSPRYSASKPGSLCSSCTLNEHNGELLDMVSEFLSRGLQGSTFTVRNKKSKEAVLLTKQIKSKGDYGLELLLSIEGEPRNNVHLLEEYITNLKTPKISIDRNESEKETQIRVDLGRDVHTTDKVIKYIFENVFRRPVGSKYRLAAENISPWQEVIDSPDQEPAGKIEGGEINDRWMRQNAGFGIASGTAHGLLIWVQLFGAIGLVITLIFQEPDWSGVGSTFGGLHVSIPWLDLISICFILVGLLAIFTESFWVDPKKGMLSGYSRVPRTVKNGFLRLVGDLLNWIYLSLIAVAFYRWNSW